MNPTITPTFHHYATCALLSRWSAEEFRRTADLCAEHPDLKAVALKNAQRCEEWSEQHEAKARELAIQGT